MTIFPIKTSMFSGHFAKFLAGKAYVVRLELIVAGAFVKLLIGAC